MSTLSYGLSGNISSNYLHVHTLYQNVVVATKMGICMGKYTPIESAAGGLATAPTPPPPRWEMHWKVGETSVISGSS